jgi:hypothetical protein
VHSVFINRPPVPSVVTTFEPGLAILDASESCDPNDEISYYWWTMREGRYFYGQSLNVSAAANDSLCIRLTTCNQ